MTSDPIQVLARFGAAVLSTFHGDGERGDVDGGHLQELAEAAGVVGREVRITPCGEVCACAEFCGDGDNVVCRPIRDDVWQLIRTPGALDALFVSPEGNANSVPSTSPNAERAPRAGDARSC